MNIDEKYNANGEAELSKGGVVAKGYWQKFGYDYDETFDLVVAQKQLDRS